MACTCIDEQPHSAKYTVREVDAASFMGPAGQLRGAPMKVTSSYILDHTIRRTEAHIEVLPPRDLPFVPSKTQKMRRVNDRKTLTALGIAALARARGSKDLRGSRGASDRGLRTPRQTAHLAVRGQGGGQGGGGYQ